jgi:hypothetical protein
MTTFASGNAKGSGISSCTPCAGRCAANTGETKSEVAAIIDSQSLKTSAVRGPEKGYDMGGKNLGQETPRAG